MNVRETLKLSLQARFGLAILLSILSFLLIALFLMFSLRHVRSHVGFVAEAQVQQAIDSSQIARELGQLLSHLALQEANYGEGNALQHDVTELLKAMKLHDHGDEQTDIIQFHDLLEGKLRSYRDQYQKISDLLTGIHYQENVLYQTLSLLDKAVAGEAENARSEGREAIFYNQLQNLLNESRSELQGIETLNLGSNPRRFATSDAGYLVEFSKQIPVLVSKLQVLADVKGPISALGQTMIGQLSDIGQQLELFRQQILVHWQVLDELYRLIVQLLERMEELEHLTVEETKEVGNEINGILLSTETTIWGLLGVLAMLLGLIQFNLYSRHIRQPMETVRKRLFRFQQGDYDSPMVLQRSDEWGQVESVFNDMLINLQESWSALQDSERRYRNIYDGTFIGIFQTTVEGDVVNINAAAAAMLGIDKDNEGPARSDIGMAYANSGDREQMISRLLQEEKINNYEVQLQRRNGETFWASLNCHLVRGKEGNIKFVEGTVEDVSLRRKTADELLKLKEYLHNIIDAMPSMLISVNSQLRVCLWNRQAAELSGVSVEQALGKPLTEVFSLVEADSYLTLVRQALANEDLVRLHKLTGTGKAEGRYFDLQVYPLKAIGSTEVALRFEDITDKAQIAEVMIQSEKMLSVGSLAAGMAHEINNPLASVLQNVQVLDQRLSPALKKNRQVAEQLGISIEQVADYARLRGFDQMIKSIAEAGQRAARIIENMLNFSRKSSSSFLPRSITELAEKTIELAGSDYDMKHNFDFRKIKLIRDFQPVPDVPCEASQIQQVILSLLKNAAQAISNDEENPEISVRVFQEKGMVCLQVEDNGAGMDETTRRRIFEPFFTTKDVGHGTGLGLSVAYFLITENHKGRLTVTSEPGKGSCFNVQLPIERKNGI